MRTAANTWSPTTRGWDYDDEYYDDYDPWSDPGDGWGDYSDDEDGWGDYF